MQGRGLSEVVDFPFGEPVQVALKYEGLGKACATAGGRTRYLFTLSDGRVMFHEEAEAQRLTQFRAGETFWMRRKRGAGKGAPPLWEMWRGAESGAAERALAPDATPLQRDLARSLDRTAPHSNGGGSLHGELVVRKEASTAGAAPSEVRPAPARMDEQTSKPSIARPKTQLEGALCTAIAAAKTAQEYAREIGFSVTFQSEDIRCMANTVLIGIQQRNGHAA
jgi:hypothetical protein